MSDLTDKDIELRGRRVTELEDHKPVWQTWWCVCIACAWHGVCVQHEDAKGFFQCPGCKAMYLLRTAPATDEPVSTKL